MLLKSDVVVKVKDDEFVFNVENRRLGKISSRVLPNVLGMNNFMSIGHAMLERFGMIVFQDIPKWYAVRGEMGEILALEYLKLYYEKHNQKGEFKTHKLQDYKGYDMFNVEYAWGNEFYGGVPDITIKGDKNFLVEVKSKNIKNFDYIVTNKKIPREELLQAQHLATLMNYDGVIMTYVFFTDKQEEDIQKLVNENKNALQIIELLKLSVNNVSIRIAFREVEKSQTINLQTRAKNELHKCFNNGSIPKRYFNEDEIKMLEKMANENNNKKDDFVNEFGQFAPF